LLATSVFLICGLWAHHFKSFSQKHIQLSFKVGRLQEENAQKVLLEEKVAERTWQLKAANDELESFSYSVSHDLRAPLRIINGYAKMLVKKEHTNLSADSVELLNVIMTNARHMGQLIDNLLDFSRLGRTSLVKHQLDMNDIVRVAIEEVKAADKNIKADIKILPMNNSLGDTSLIKQVWANLISNAVKYSRNRQYPVIEIGSIGHNGGLTYYIKDNGAGFDMAHSDKLFAVFQRLHKVTEYEGTGVGLALTHRIISKHGGKIWADSQIDHGATFYFTLNS
jgi:light-regulated signal transduction histidine kinase (bacteriophytochrome)